jgi:hypothetical protein
MSDDPQGERIRVLLAKLEALPFEERESVIASLSEEDRETVWASEPKAADESLPGANEEPGGEG